MSRRWIASIGACAASVAMVVALAAQGGGTGGGGGQGGGTGGGQGGGFGGGGGGRGGGGGGGGFQMPTRLAMLTSAFKLDKAQVPAVKNILDDAGKDPAVVAARAELAASHAAIGAVIEKGGSAEAIDAAVKTYAAASQTMANLELAALARVIKSLNETQRGNTSAVTLAASLMRGAFVDKKWDVTPGVGNY